MAQGTTNTRILTPVQLVGLFLGVGLMVLFQMLPGMGPITAYGMKSIGIFLFFLIWLVLGPVHMYITCIATMALFVLFGVQDLNQLASNFGNWINIFLIGAFAIGKLIDTSGFARRYALRMVTFGFVRGHPWRLFMMFVLAPALLSAVSSNTVATVIFMTIGIGLLETLGIQRGERFGCALMMCIAWAANIGGNVTPAGSAMNLAGIAMTADITGYTISFFEWTVVGLTQLVTSLIFLYLIIRYVLKPDVSRLVGGRGTAAIAGGDTAAPPSVIEMADAERLTLGPMTGAEWWSVIYLLGALALWMAPDLVGFFSEDGKQFLTDYLGWAVVAILIPTLACVTPVTLRGERRMLLNWREWTGSVEWGVLALIAAARMVGASLGSTKTGIPQLIGSAFASLGVSNPYILTAMFTIGAIYLTDAITNTAVITVFVPMILSISTTLGIGNPMAMAIVTKMASSMAFSMPFGTTTTAIVFGTGYISVPLMLQNGLLMDLLAAVGLFTAAYTVGSFMLPWPLPTG